MPDLFIPKRIKVVYVERDDTYTKRLAYVIYFDNKGVLRKQTSWDSWRDEKIAPEEYDNLPQSGFVLNKNVQRCNWSHFGSNRSMIRIYDPRGIEFEITPENLIGILMETTCSKRGLEGEFVYAWAGKDLLVLPTSSEAYQKAVTYTARQDQKIPAKELKQGCSYTTKDGKEVIYLGRFNWFQWKRYENKGRVSNKAHIFAYPNVTGSSQFFPKGDVSFLATLNNPDPVANYADLMDTFKGDIHSSTVTGWEIKPFKASLAAKQHSLDGRATLIRQTYCQFKDNIITFYEIKLVQADHKLNGRYWYTNSGYYITKRGTLNTTTFEKSGDSSYSSSYYRDRSQSFLTEEQTLAELEKFVEVYMILESGKKLCINGLYDYSD